MVVLPGKDICHHTVGFDFMYYQPQNDYIEDIFCISEYGSTDLRLQSFYPSSSLTKMAN